MTFCVKYAQPKTSISLGFIRTFEDAWVNLNKISYLCTVEKENGKCAIEAYMGDIFILVNTFDSQELARQALNEIMEDGTSQCQF